MNFIKAKLFLILCLAVVALGIGLFVVGYLVNAKNKEELQRIEQVVGEVDQLRNKLVHDNEITQINNNVVLADEDHQQALSRIKETTARPLIHPEALDEGIRGADRIIHYERFADYYCQFINDLIDDIGGGDRPSEAEEEQRRQNFFGGQRGVTGARMGTGAAIGTVDQNLVNKWIEADRKKRAESIAIYTTPEAFCCYNHWLGRPRDNDHKKMLSDIWYTQIAAWIQEDVAGAVKQMNGDKKSVYLSPVKRLLSIGFGGSSPSGASSIAGGRSGRSGAPSSGSGGPGGATVARADQNILPCYILASATSDASVATAASMGGMDPTAMGVPPGAMGVPPGTMTDPAAAMGLPPAAVDPVTLAMTATAPSFTGIIVKATPDHVSNNDVNVVQFEINVIVDSSCISEFINTLQSVKQYTLAVQPDGSTMERNERNQITVLQMEMEPVDVIAENQQGYYYGSASVKKLRLICQYIFFRSGYEDMMPQPIKALFGTL